MILIELVSSGRYRLDRPPEQWREASCCFTLKTFHCPFFSQREYRFTVPEGPRQSINNTVLFLSLKLILYAQISPTTNFLLILSSYTITTLHSRYFKMADTWDNTEMGGAVGEVEESQPQQIQEKKINKKKLAESVMQLQSQPLILISLQA